MSKEKYLDILNPISEDQLQSHSLLEGSLSLFNLKKLNMDQQIHAIFKNVPIMNFSRLCELVSQARTEQQLLFQLEVVAVLVRGVWTARGEFLFTGQLAIIWDFLLLQFHEEGYIEREKLKQNLKVSIPGDELKELLLKLAVLKEDKKWVLKVDPDQHFLEKYPTIVQKFKNDWDLRKKSILSSLGLFDVVAHRAR